MRVVTRVGRAMKVSYSVTFEFMNDPPLTHRGTIAASKENTCVSKAVRQAKQALRPKRWSSLVCVLLERLPEDRAPAVPE